MASSRLIITAPSPGSSDRRSPKASINAVSANVRWGCACMFIAFADPISRRFADHAGIAIGLEIERQRLVARLDDLALVEHVHTVRHDVLEQALVVGDDQERPVWRTQRVDAVG